METKSDELQVKLLAVEKALQKLEFIDAASEFNPLRPPLWRLFEHAVDSWRYYHSLFIKASCACACIVYTELESVENMKRAFEIDQTSANYILSILEITEKYEES